MDRPIEYLTPQLVTGLHGLKKPVDERGGRYCITARVGKGSYAYMYADTGEEAEKAATYLRDKWEYGGVEINPPVADTPIADGLELLGARREELAKERRDVTAHLRAMVLRAHEHGFAEADIARRGRIDRMTVRKWLGKR